MLVNTKKDSAAEWKKQGALPRKCHLISELIWIKNPEQRVNRRFLRQVSTVACSFDDSSNMPFKFDDEWLTYETMCSYSILDG